VQMLMIFAGLPGTGKTTIARKLARLVGAVHLRIDTIEEALRACGSVPGQIDEAGYRVAYALAEDNLRLGRNVIADCVNPLKLTRDAWLEVARRANTPALEIEIFCSDVAAHQRRVESRTAEAGEKRITWQDVLSREYHAWDHEHIVIDTATQTVESIVEMVKALIEEPSSDQEAYRALSESDQDDYSEM
jgi:predicted kinase